MREKRISFLILARREERKMTERRTEKSEATIIIDTNTTNPSNITSNSKYLRDQGAFICFVKKKELNQNKKKVGQDVR